LSYTSSTTDCMSDSSMVHNGTVADITLHGLKIALHEDSGQCGSCSIKSFCKPHEHDKDNRNIIDVTISATDKFSIGDEVTVYCSERQQTAAMILSLALPCLLLVAAVLTALAADISEGKSACCGLAVTVAYYALLYAFRRKLRKRFNRMKICHRLS